MQEAGLLGADYVNLDRKTKTSTIIKGAIARKIVRDGISEEERVLYVAMTRAREKLIMMGNVTDTDKAMTGWNSIADEIRMSGIYSYADCEKIDKFADMVIPVVLTGKEYNKGEFNIKLIGVEEINSLLNKSDIRVEIETNGAVDIAPLANAFSKEKLSLTMDYKLPSSGCEEKMLLSNMEALRKQDTVKFVSGSINDLECAEKIIEKFHLTERCQVFISSVFGSIEPVEIVNFMTSKRMNDVRLQIQMHKVIWNPEERGV